MSTREKCQRVIGLFLVGLILVVCASPQFRALITLPDHLRLPLQTSQHLALNLPLQVKVRPSVPATAGGMVRSGLDVILGTPSSIAALQLGQYTVDFRLFGLIPLRKLTVDVVPPIKVVPGGHSIGVLLKSQGVMVVGHGTVRDGDGQVHQPGRDGGIDLGDAILKVDGVSVSSDEHAASLFDEAGQARGFAVLTIRRKGALHEVTVRPVKERETGRWRVGLYIRDGAAGVGTLTFVDPASRKYGALGHVIADGESRNPIDVASGHIVEAEVAAIEKGRKATPGEKVSRFPDVDNWIGSIDKNTRFGIFGRLNGPLENPLYPEPVPVAMAGQVREGPAELLTVVEGQKMERFTVEIVRIMRQPTVDGKNMIVKVTDPRLLEKTGGIVQGMSGSPLMQDGRIVGAVTHVFVNDPARGYGVLIEWMLQEAGVLTPQKSGSSGTVLPGAFVRVSTRSANPVTNE